MHLLDLESIAEKIAERFTLVEKARDTSYILHRDIIKKSGLAIRAVHRNDKDLAKALLADIVAMMNKSNEALEGFDELPINGFMRDAQKEFVEASVTTAIVFGEKIPNPDELGVSYAAYMNGLSEVVGELRRKILDVIRLDMGNTGETYLSAMEEIYAVLVAMDFSDAITCGLRRSTDQARGILERTRGDFTNYLESKRLRGEIRQYMEQTNAARAL